MNTSLKIIPGRNCLARGRVVQIDGWDSLHTVQVRDLATGELMPIPIHELQPLTHGTSPESRFSVPEIEWERAIDMAQDFKTLIEGAPLQQCLAVSLAIKYEVSVRQIRRIVERFRQDPRPSTLVRKHGGRPHGLRLLSHEVEIVIRHVLDKHFYCREPISKTEVVERAQGICRRIGLQPPCAKAVFTRIDDDYGYKSECRRMGSKAAKQQWAPKPGMLEVEHPLDLVQIDHTRVDLMVLSDDRSEVIGRPWLTVAVDVATRCVLGIYLSMYAPSAVSVSLCIEHAVLPKNENSTEVDLWPMYGKPKKIHVDNGKELRSKALKRGCAEYGIDIQWRPVRTPHYGGHIERLLGTLMKMV